MIALRNNRPLLQTGSCVIGDYDLDWLVGLLDDAAKQGGVALPFKREIAMGIMSYLEGGCPLRTLPLEYLITRIREMLNKLGLNRIAQNLRKLTPPIDVKLDAIAEEAPLPLFFYAELKRRVEQLRELGLTTYHFTGVEDCSLRLSARQRSCPATRREQDEIVAFLQLGAA